MSPTDDGTTGSAADSEAGRADMGTPAVGVGLAPKARRPRDCYGTLLGPQPH